MRMAVSSVGLRPIDWASALESLPVFGQGGRAPPRSATRGRVGFLGASPGKTIEFAKQVKLLRVNVTDLDRQIEALDAARSAAPETAGIIKTVAAAGEPKLAANVMNTVMSGERAEAKARSGQRAERRRRRRFGRLTGTDRRFACARSRTHTKLKDQPPITNGSCATRRPGKQAPYGRSISATGLAWRLLEISPMGQYEGDRQGKSPEISGALSEDFVPRGQAPRDDQHMASWRWHLD
jgi:hypothetical protein